MTNTGDASKKARRDHAREAAREMREKEQKRRQRRKWLVQGIVGVSILLVAAIVTVAIFTVNANKPSGVGPLNMASNGIVLEASGDGTNVKAVSTAAVKKDGDPAETDQSSLSGNTHIVMYVDYQCPVCKTFEETNGANIKAFVASGQATVEIHPISMLDQASLGNKYSTRATNAMACVANYAPDKYLDVNNAFFANQPAEQTNGLSDDEIIANVKTGGVDDEKVTACIKNKTFTDWVAGSSRLVTSGVFPDVTADGWKGTPTVIVNHQTYTGAIDDATAFAAFLDKVKTDATPAPTPSATGTPVPSN